MIQLTWKEQDDLDKVNRAAELGLLTEDESYSRRRRLAVDAFKDRMRVLASDPSTLGKQPDAAQLLAELCDVFAVEFENHRYGFRDVLMNVALPSRDSVSYELKTFETLRPFFKTSGHPIISGTCAVSIMVGDNEIFLDLNLFWQSFSQSLYRCFGTFQHDEFLCKFEINVWQDFSRGTILFKQMSPGKPEVGTLVHYRIINCQPLKNMVDDHNSRQEAFRHLRATCAVHCQGDDGSLSDFHLQVTGIEMFPKIYRFSGYTQPDNHPHRFTATLSDDFGFASLEMYKLMD
jgi:hypothetical protein